MKNERSRGTKYLRLVLVFVAIVVFAVSAFWVYWNSHPAQTLGHWNRAMGEITEGNSADVVNSLAVNGGVVISWEQFNSLLNAQTVSEEVVAGLEIGPPSFVERDNLSAFEVAMFHLCPYEKKTHYDEGWFEGLDLSGAEIWFVEGPVEYNVWVFVVKNGLVSNNWGRASVRFLFLDHVLSQGDVRHLK